MSQEKKFFLFIFIILITAGILSILGNVAIFILGPHFVIFFVAMFFLYEKTLSFTLKKIGIPGDTKKNIIYAIIGLTAIVVTQILTGIVLSSPSAEEDIKQAATLSAVAKGQQEEKQISLAKVENNPKIDSRVTSKAVSTVGLTFLAFAFIMDLAIVERRKIPRIVGHNLDHIMLIIGFLIFAFLQGRGVIL